MVKRYYYDEIPKAFLLLTRKVQLVEYKDYEALEQKLAESKSEIADLRSIEREHIKTIAELEKQNGYVSTWMEKYHESEVRNAELEKHTDHMDDALEDATEEMKTMDEQIKDLEQKANRYRNLANQMIDDLCVVCKVHNPQHKDCTSCDQVEDYRETLTEGKE